MNPPTASLSLSLSFFLFVIRNYYDEIKSGILKISVMQSTDNYNIFRMSLFYLFEII